MGLFFNSVERNSLVATLREISQKNSYGEAVLQEVLPADVDFHLALRMMFFLSILSFSTSSELAEKADVEEDKIKNVVSYFLDGHILFSYDHGKKFILTNKGRKLCQKIFSGSPIKFQRDSPIYFTFKK